MDITDVSGNSPLILSYNLNFMEIFEYLLSYSNIITINRKDINNKPLLYHAIEKEDVSTINYLLCHYAICYNSCIEKVISKGYKLLSILLNNNGCKIDLNTTLFSIIKSNNLIEKEKIEAIKILIKKGANVNYENENHKTPLIHALQLKSLSIVEILVENGANINYKKPNISYKYSTILKCALDSGKIDIVKYLVKRNINCKGINSELIFGSNWTDINKFDDEIINKILDNFDIKKVTGDMVENIIKYEKLEVLKLLVKNKLDLNIKDRCDYSVIANAIYHKKVSIIKYLLLCDGINYESKTNDDKSIFDLNEKYLGENILYKNIYNKIKQKISTYNS